MTHTRWSIEGPDATGIELKGRKFSSDDEGAPMMCNLVCSSMGRHIHIDYCRSEDGVPCSGDELQHINASRRMIPDPDRPKDAITHKLYWRRMGMLDTFSWCSLRQNFRLQDLKVASLNFPHECVLIFATDPYTHDEETDFRMWCAWLFFNVALLNFLIAVMPCVRVCTGLV